MVVILDYLYDGLKKPESHRLILSLRKEAKEVCDICSVFINKIIAIILSLLSNLDIRLGWIEQDVDSVL
jgi:hypothetical protein